MREVESQGRLLRKQGKLDNVSCADALDALRARAAQQRLPLGEAPSRSKRRCAFLDGFSLHANTWVHENDRDNLIRLCGYGARGPLCLERLSLLPDGRVAYRMKRPAASGQTVLVLEPSNSARHAATAEVRLFDRLFSVESPDDPKHGRDYKELINKASLEVVSARLEPSLAAAAAGERFQFERLGYLCADPDGRPGAPVFTRTVTLEDTWAKERAKG